VNGDGLRVGDVVARGARVAEGVCDMGAVEVRTTAPGNGQTQWLAFQVDGQCRAVVAARWQGRLEDGPASVVGPLQELMDTESSRVPVRVEEQAGRQSLRGARFSRLAQSGTKTSEQHVYMYGYGGIADKLTNLRSSITFTYNGSSATITNEGGWCAGSQPFNWYAWVVDNCWGRVSRGPASSVWFEHHGEYHCNPASTAPCSASNPDGYYHSLISTITGNANGSSTCTIGSTGTIVDGIGRYTVQGCN
jgi:hypothetical protein